MTDERAWYLIARTEDGTPVAFSHFRYDMDYDDEVVYCYEIQVEKSYRRKGLGKFMMKVLELLYMKADMLKLMATIFKNDRPKWHSSKKASSLKQMKHRLLMTYTKPSNTK